MNRNAEIGRIAYERDVAMSPNYHDGSKRPSWNDLSAVAKWSWNRNPTDRGELKALAEGLRKDLALNCVEVNPVRYDFTTRIQVHIPIEHNGGKWCDEYRATLNRIAHWLSNHGFRWAADYPGENHLISDGDNAWMLFNGGTTITLMRER